MKIKFESKSHSYTMSTITVDINSFYYILHEHGYLDDPDRFKFMWYNFKTDIPHSLFLEHEPDLFEQPYCVTRPLVELDDDDEERIIVTEGLFTIGWMRDLGLKEIEIDVPSDQVYEIEDLLS